MKNYTIIEYEDGTRVALPLDNLQQLRGAIALVDAIGQRTMRVFHTSDGAPSLYPPGPFQEVAT